MPRLSQDKTVRQYYEDAREALEIAMMDGDDNIRGDLLNLAMVWKYVALNSKFDELKKAKLGTDPLLLITSTPEYHEWRAQQNNMEVENSIMREELAKQFKD